MDTAPITTKTFLIGLFALIACEAAASEIAAEWGVFPLEALGLARIIEITVLILIVFSQKKDIGIMGLSRSRLRAGIAAGIICSLIFALTAAMGFGISAILGYQPFDLIKVSLPTTHKDLYIFFLVGGIIAPIAEEIFFRGLLFGYLSQWNVPGAVLGSSLIFLFFHPQGGIIQITGGLVFALTYHFSRSLAAPMIIHSMGNLALFTISLLAHG